MNWPGNEAKKCHALRLRSYYHDYEMLTYEEVTRLCVSSVDSRQLYVRVCWCLVGDSETRWQRSACVARGQGGVLQSPRPLLFLGAR